VETTSRLRIAKDACSEGLDELANPRADFATTALESHLSAFEQVCNSRDSFTAIFAATADREDQIPEAVLGTVGFAL
jgi:hypothetical protein